MERDEKALPGVASDRRDPNLLIAAEMALTVRVSVPSSMGPTSSSAFRAAVSLCSRACWSHLLEAIC